MLLHSPYLQYYEYLVKYGKEMIEIQNLDQKFKGIKKKPLIRIAEFVLQEEGAGDDIEISVVFIESDEMRRINKQYRHKDKPTDVLSFGEIRYFYDPDKFILPEILICPEEVSKNAQEYGVSFEEELAKVLIHGILHLLGFDHERGDKEEEEMLNKQEKYLSIFFK